MVALFWLAKKISFKRLLKPVSLAAVLMLVFFLADKFLEGLKIPNAAQDFITLSLSIFVEALPFIFLGSLLAGIVNTYLKPHIFEKVLPKNGIFRRGVISLLGFLFPVCECGNVPLSRALMIQGLKPSEAITFLLAAPVINPVTIWSTWVAFSYDGSIVVSRVAATFVIANVIGFILSLKKREQDFLKDDFAALCNSSDEKLKKESGKFLKLSNSFTHEAFTMMKMLAFGAIIAGLVQSFVPRDILVGIGGNVVLSILAMLLLAFVVSICANVDAFFALSFANTFTSGSIVSFLVFGPMVDIKMLALLKTTFKNELLITISVLSLLMSTAAGLVVSYAF